MTSNDQRDSGRARFSVHELALVGVSVLWGATFLIIHTAMDYVGPFTFVGVRFLVAGLLAAVIFARWLRGITRIEVTAGVAIGVVMALGYGLQTSGLQTVDSSMSGFITAFYVPLVPLMQWGFLRIRPRTMSFVGAGLAFLGLVLLGNPGAAGLQFGVGEWLTALSAIVFAGEIILISLFAGRVEFRRVTVVQLLVVGVVALIAAPVTGESSPTLDWRWIVPAIGLGVMSMLIQLAMNWAQRHVTATRATIIYSAEPVWAGVFGWLAGERLPWLALLGAGCVVAGVLVSELRPRRERPE